MARILRAFAALGVLDEIHAILFGRPGGDIPASQFAEYDRVLLDMVNNEVGRTDLPIVSRMDFGHTDPMLVLPYGCLCEIDCDQHTVTISESAVLD